MLNHPSTPVRFCLFFLLGSAAVLALAVSVSASAANDAACAALSSAAFDSAALTPVPSAAVLPNVCASIWAGGIPVARGMLTLPHDGGLIVVSRTDSTASLVWLNDTDSSGSIDSASATERKTLATVAGLNHGIALWRPASGDPDDAVLLASRDSTVYRWPFSLSSPAATLSNDPEALVANMPAGGHWSRTLILDSAAQWLYVSMGSEDNVDSTPARSGLWRFNLSSTPTAGAGQPFDWSADGQLFVSGLRNEVALTWDRLGVLWGAENGADRLSRADIGGDVHNDNPGEEINKFDRDAGAFYGYPYCFSEFLLDPSVARGPGAQWAWPSFLADGVHNDSWCRSEANVVPPRTVMPAHTAPLGMRFYPRETAESAAFALPPPPATAGSSDAEYLIVAQHGSWNRSPPSGYRVVRFPSSVVTGSEAAGVQIAGPQENVLWFDSADGSATGAGWGRPVDVALGARGEVYISDDSLGRIIVLRQVNVNTTNSSSSSGSSSGSSSSSSTGGGGGGGGNGAGSLAAAPIPTLVVLLLVWQRLVAAA